MTIIDSKKKKNLILDMLKWQLSECRRGDGSSLGSGSGIVLCGSIGCLCAGAGRCVSGVCMTTAGGAGTTSGHRHERVGRRERHER